VKIIFSKSAAKGTSLIELIIYISILSIVLLSMTVFLVSNKKMEGRYKAMTEVEIQGAEIMRLVTQAIRNAQSVGSPAIGTNGPSLSLVVSAPAKNPTVFDLAGGKVRMKEGSASATDLNSGQVSISNLNFKNMSSANAPGSIRVSFDVSYANPGHRAELNYSKKYVDSASIPQ
jgi:Tfp pilus assembly protein PilW